MTPTPTKILVIFGTRPEVIKLAPVIHALQGIPRFQVRSCNTGQHREMVDQILPAFRLTPDIDLKLMQKNQSVEDLTARMLTQLAIVLAEEQPHLVIVQGDTTSAFTGALASAYAKIPIAHVESGLRSHDHTSPFPEELNRVLIDQLSTYHFAATPDNQINLHREGLSAHTSVVGNTVVDAVQLIKNNLTSHHDTTFKAYFEGLGLSFQSKLVLITCHRRESFGKPFQEICKAIDTLSQQHPEVQFVFPVHLNPKIQNGVKESLTSRHNLHLIAPLDYPQMIWIMTQAHCILSDSGGIQEEAASLAKPVLVLRSITERPEGLATGIAKLVGRDGQSIIAHTHDILTNPTLHATMSQAQNPYGDGQSSLRIAAELAQLI